MKKRVSTAGLWLAALLLLAAPAFGEEAPRKLGKVVVVVDLRAAREPIRDLLKKAGWEVEHWISTTRAKPYLEPEAVERLAARYKGRLLVIAQGEQTRGEPDATGERKYRATVTLHVFDSAAKSIATGKGTETAENAETALNEAVGAAGDAIREAIKKAADRIVVEREYKIVIQLHHRNYHKEYAEPLLKEVVSAIGKGEETLHQEFNKSGMRFEATVRFTGTAAQLAKLVVGTAKKDAKFLPLVQESIVGNVLHYRFSLRSVRIRVKDLDKKVFSSEEKKIAKAVAGLSGVRKSWMGYSEKRHTLTVQATYRGDAWKLEEKLSGALGAIEPFASLELVGLTAYRIEYRLAGKPVPFRITVSNVTKAFHDGKAAGAKLLEILKGQKKAGLEIVKDRYDPDSGNTWVFDCKYGGRREDLDRLLWAAMREVPALAGLRRARADRFLALHYLMPPEYEKTTSFAIRIGSVGTEELKGICDDFWKTVMNSKALDVRNPNKIETPSRDKKNPMSGNVKITGWTTLTLTEFYRALERDVLSQERFKNLVPQKFRNQAIALRFEKTRFEMAEVEVDVLGVSPLHNNLYARPFLEAVGKLTGASGFRKQEYASRSYTARVEGAFKGTGLALLDAIEKMRKKDKGFGPQLQPLGAKGNTVTYAIRPAGERLVLVGNVPPEKIDKIAGEIQALAAKAGKGKVTVTKVVKTKKDEKDKKDKKDKKVTKHAYIVASVASEVPFDAFVADLAGRFAGSALLKNTVRREVYLNVIEFSFPSKDDPLGQPTGPFNNRVLPTGGMKGPAQAVSMRKVVRAAQRSAPSVVLIRSRQGGAVWDGAGVIVSKQGYIITTRRAIRPQVAADKMVPVVSVKIGDRWYRARKVAEATRHSLVLLQVPGERFAAVEMAGSEAVKKGSTVFSLGRLLGEGWRPGGITVGLVGNVDTTWVEPSGPLGSGERFEAYPVIKQTIIAYETSSGTAVFDREGRLAGFVVGGRPVPETRLTYFSRFISSKAAGELLRMIGG